MNVGERIQDRYVLEGPLGQGGMAEVWCARDEHLGRQVAVKFLAPQLSLNPEFLVRFFAEAQSVARISHPNVVQILDFGEHEERPILVMEYVGGGSLADLGEKVSEERALEIVLQIADGVGAAHQIGLVHRDIKPGNILIADDGTAKLADFGISSNGAPERMTATGAALGSPHFISPEQVAGMRASPASDVYSLGIVLYELLTGRRPFEGDNITAVAIAHVDKIPEAPRSLNPDIDPWVDSLVLRCLDKDPAARFATGDALAAALRAAEPSDFTPSAIAGTEVPGLLAGAWEEEEEEEDVVWSRRRRLVGAGLTVLLLALASAGVMAARRDAPATSDADVTEAKEEKGSSKRKKRPSPSVSASPSPSALAEGETSVSEPAETPSSPPEKGGDSNTTETKGSSPAKETRDGKGKLEPEPEPEPSAEPEPSSEPEPSAEPSSEPTPQPTSSGE